MGSAAYFKKWAALPFCSRPVCQPLGPFVCDPISIHKAASRVLQRGEGQGGPLLLVPVRPDRRGGGLDQVRLQAFLLQAHQGL